MSATVANLEVYVLGDSTSVSSEIQVMFNSMYVSELSVTLINGVVATDDEYEDTMSILEGVTQPDPPAIPTYVVVMKPEVVSTSSGTTILKTISEIIQDDIGGSTPRSFDLTYLVDANDRCELFTNLSQINTRGAQIVDTKHASTSHAILYSPAGIEKLLNYSEPSASVAYPDWLMYKAGARNDSAKLHPQTIYPSLLHFSIEDITDDKDFEYTNQCKPVIDTYVERHEDNTYLFLIIFVISLIILVLILVTIKYFDKRKNKYHKKEQVNKT